MVSALKPKGSARRHLPVVREFNAASRLLGELRRTLGARLAAVAAPIVLAKIGLAALDVSRADPLRQGELDLRPRDRAE